MKNLKVHHHKVYDLKENLEKIFQKFENTVQLDKVCCSCSSDSSLIIVISNIVYHYNLKEAEQLNILCTIDIDPNFKPVGIAYLLSDNIAYIAYDSGDLIEVRTQLPSHSEINTHFDDGLKCIQLSPDQKILVLVTGNNRVITKISDLEETLSEIDLESEDFGEKQFVTVGWGHKATQFHGSEGKAAATAKQVIVGKTERDSGKSYITWRGDGALFAVSFFNKKSDIRQFKVFNRVGVLQYTSELTHGLEEMIAWRPSGNYISAPQQLTDKYVISLFEKNGLKHREFTLPFKAMDVEIKELLWSPDSEILTMWVKKDKKSLLQLWTIKNYHWYLKQTIEFPQDDLLYFTWAFANKQLILLTRENMMIYQFTWAVNHSRCVEMNDKAVVGVIDGDKVLLTGFRMGIVPPPMSHYSLQINSAINECFFAPRSQSWLNPNSFFALLQNNQLALCVYEDVDSLTYKYVRSYKIEWEVPEIQNENIYYSMHHFLWLKEDTILCSLSSLSKNFNYLCIIHLENINPDKDGGRIVVREALKMNNYVQHIVSSPDVNIAYVLVGSHVLKYVDGQGVTETGIFIGDPCDQMEVVEMENRHVIVTLTSTNGLYINSKIVAQNITSLSVHSDFLLLTTHQDTLVCVILTADGFERLSMTNLNIQPWTNECQEQHPRGLDIRRVERSSSLIISIPYDSKVILQMDRGNLEVIQPRPLSLHILKNHLNALNYFQAFDIMRKQRINLNLIYDHNPKLFMDNAEKFVDSIKNSQWLNLFIAELQEEDVTKTIYQASYSEQEHDVTPKEGKVESICRLLREIMEEKSDRNLIQPILTSLVKNKHIPGIETALWKIKEYKMKEEMSEGNLKSADEALKYLLYLVDVNMLYDIALGMYDLDLTKYVAVKSQKDPKEYVPYLNSLAELEENYRKYKIDKDLKRYESALEHIVKCPDKFDECIELIRNHNLYFKAIKLLPKDKEEYKEIEKMYGQYLSENRHYREAGIMFERNGDLESALKMYKIIGSWQSAIIISTKMNLNPNELNKFYEDLVTQLKEDRRYRDAAELCLAYLGNSEEAVSLLCEGREWRDALRVTHTSKRLDLIETHVKPGIYQHAIDIDDKINKNKEEFIRLKNRLIIVRKEKARKEAEALTRNFQNFEDEEPGQEFSDLLSDTSSVAGSVTSTSSKSSRTSGRSYRSSKNKRKHERKFLSIKEGSAFEDLAIIQAIHNIASNSYAQREEVCNINRILLNFYFDELAEKLQNSLIEMINMIEKNKHDIWLKNLSKVDPPNNETDANMPQHILEPKFTYPPDVISCNWILEIFPPPPSSFSKSRSICK
ncbi:putative elongator complex protein 1 [Chelonus insularis]|uniref:putative elongator complex protein 1 n=1 Tax=Chelonus insularis TaxID=460826 RepID=UPI00158E7994|nr:putative elongator complex protein 1 [Chelonus insularis]